MLRYEFSIANLIRFQTHRIVPCSLALIVAAGPSLADSWEHLVRIHYDLEVASYCGLVTDTVLKGFHTALQVQIDSAGTSFDDIEQARMQAWKDAHWEWQNRGLGGFKYWCANEAMEGARRLESHLAE